MDQPLAPVIVVGCLKGGVGRTVVAVNLASMLALSGKRTLLIDLDPSGDATASLGLPRCSTGKTLDCLADSWGLLKAVVTVECSPGGPLSLEIPDVKRWRPPQPGVAKRRHSIHRETDGLVARRPSI